MKIEQQVSSICSKEICGPQLTLHLQEESTKTNTVVIIAAAVLAAMMLSLPALADEGANPAPDYSRKECWSRFPEITRDVDTFCIYATEYIMGSFEEGAPDYATIDNAEMHERVEVVTILHATAFEPSTSLFVPYYRQAGARYAAEVYASTGSTDSSFTGIPHDDITAALDDYFEHCNGGRPFILAGHSQGSGMVLLMLQTCFREHPEYDARMVAAYAIGCSVTDDCLAANPHVKFATGESDTGVVIAWNTEGPKKVETNATNILLQPHTRSINPLNWKLDETCAPASMNLGFLVENEENGETGIRDIGTDAQVNLARGSVVTNARGQEIPEELAEAVIELYGPDGHHNEDYLFFYSNIRDNADKRIAAYMAAH